MPTLPPHLKKLFGTLFLIVWLAFYALLIMQVGVAILPDAHWLTELIFYAVAGTAWIIPVGFLLPWMHRGRD